MPSLITPTTPSDAAIHQVFDVDAWNVRLGAVCGAFQTETSSESIVGSISSRSFMGLDIAHVHVGPSLITRNQKAARSDGAAYYFLIGQKTSQSHIQHQNRSVLLQPGDLILVDSTQESRFIYPDPIDVKNSCNDISGQISMHIPRRHLEGIVSPDQIGSRIAGNSNLAQCIWQQFNALMEIDGLLKNAQSQNGHFEDLFLNAFTHLFMTGRHQARFVQTVLDLLKQSEGFSPELGHLAGRSACSRRTMSRIFEQRGMSLGDLLKYIRLLHFLRLCSTAVTTEVQPAISSLIYQAGFSDVSNFNHLFKATFGLSPRELMAHGDSPSSPRG